MAARDRHAGFRPAASKQSAINGHSPVPALGHWDVASTQEAAIRSVMPPLFTAFLRRVQVAFLPFTRRWPRMSGLTAAGNALAESSAVNLKSSDRP
jgi:hypothetical protein